MDFQTFFVGFFAIMGVFDLMHCIVHMITEHRYKIDTAKYTFKKFE